MRESKRVKCIVCGKVFESKAPNSKYCSLICRDKGNRQRRAQWLEDHPTYYREYFNSVRKGESKC